MESKSSNRPQPIVQKPTAPPGRYEEKQISMLWKNINEQTSRLLTVAPSSESHTSEVAKIVPSAANAFATTKAPFVFKGITVS